MTVNKGGGPQVTVVWIGLDGDEAVSGHLGLYRRPSNVARDPRISISIEAPRRPGVSWPCMRCCGAQPNLLQRLGRVCVAPDFDFPLPQTQTQTQTQTRSYVLRTRAERVGGVGPWAGSR